MTKQSAEPRVTERKQAESVAISNAESRDRVRALADEQAALRRVATLVAEGATTPVLCAAVVEEVVGVLGVPAAWLLRYEPERTMTVVASINDPAFPIGSRWPLVGTSVTARVFETGRPARIDDFSELPGPIAARTRESGFISSLGVPIVVDGLVWGAICAGTTEREPLPADTVARLSDFTELVATAISNAASRERVQALVEEQAALHRVATLVARAAPPEQIFAAVADEAARLLGLPRIEVVRFGPGESGTVIGASGDHPFPVGSTWSFDGPSIMSSVFHTGRVARIDDYSRLPGTIADIARQAGFVSAIGTPIMVDGRTWGTIIAISTSPEPAPIPEGAESRLNLFTELIAAAVSNLQAHDDLRGLADEQAALRRVATLVAEGMDAAEIFDAVCVETGELLGATSVNLSRYTPDGFNVTVSGWSLRGTHVPIGTRVPLESESIGGAIVRTQAPTRIDRWDDLSSEMARLVREHGVRSSVGAPIVVDGQLWGALVAATDREQALPVGTELRLARFTELIATAISNAATRAELIASRARIVAAGDEARRRIERNLHDGTQQRLIALGLDLQRIRATIPEDQREAHLGFERVASDLESVLDDLRELSRGLHPPLLSRRGLPSSLRALARASPIPVDLDVDLPGRLPASIETAVYYIVSEALTNAIRYSQASSITVNVSTDHAGGPFGVGLDGRGRIVNLHATIADDGVGGAEPTVGSGLGGLVDRVDALGGRLVLDTPVGRGTRISVELPLEQPA
jgi:GAF domain-containing protein